MARPRIAFIDWFKCLGMAVIVYGHTAAWTAVSNFPPIYIKQFGVALFLFAAAFSLAREQRTPGEALFVRLFEIYLFGIAIALIISSAGAVTTGKLAVSNYLPFAFGANLIFDHFPANPTTWYIGTYVHFLVLWAVVLRRIRLRLGHIAVAALVEIPIRMLLLQHAGNFIAYMALPNWLTVFLVGYYFGQRGITAFKGASIVWLAALLATAAVWWFAARRTPVVGTFPLMTPASPGLWPLFLDSCAVTVVYVGFTLLAFGAFAKLRAPAAVTLVARHTVIIFIAHMPLVFEILRLFPDDHANWVWRTVLMMVVSLPGLTALSYYVHRWPALPAIREATRRMLGSAPRPAEAAASL